MKPEDKLALSFYREVEPIGKKDNVFLVRHSETGEFFVKKIYTHYDSDIYNKGFFDGIERAMECVQLENLSSEAKEDLDYYYDTYYDYVYGRVENENLLPGLPPEVEQRINN